MGSQGDAGRDELADELNAFLDALPVASGQTRRIRDVPKRLRPDMRLTELFDAWQEKRSPSGQTTGDYRASIADLIDYIGDIPVSQLFGSLLFTVPDGWSWRHKTTDCTLYWLFLIACLNVER